MTHLNEQLKNWPDFHQHLNSRQIFFLSKLDTLVFSVRNPLNKRITNMVYKNIVNTTRESAKRDLQGLEALGILVRDADLKGRNAGYLLT